jgi:hypothetical protein
MTTRISRDFVFQAGVHVEDIFQMNTYDISLAIGVETENIREQNIAMERISYYLIECLDSCIFVHETEKKVIDKYLAAGLQVCTLPAEPYDQIVNVMLFLKLNAICEGKLEITDMSLGSALSNGVSYMYNSECAVGPFHPKGWWYTSAATITDAAKQNKKDKIVQLFASGNDWDDNNLGWKEKESVFIIDKEITFIPEPVK